jgi:hypothetical protein
MNRKNCIMRSFIIMTSKSIRWVRRVADVEDIRNAHIVLVGKTEGKRPLGRPGCRWEDIKVYLKQGVKWNHLAQHRIM